MGRFHRGLTIGATAASLVVAGLVGTAGAEEVPATEAVEEAGAAPLVARKHGPSEVTGPAASINSMRSGRLRCGEVITRSTTLTADVGPCPGNGIIIGADDIMLNLNGHTISGAPGPGDGNTAGVRLPMRRGVVVTGQPGSSGRMGTVTGFDAGVLVNGGSGNTVENLVARDNIGPGTRDAFLGDGIAVLNSSNNTIQRNTVDHNGIYDGIGVLGNDSHDNMVKDNAVSRSVAMIDPSGIPTQQTTGTGVGIVIDAFLEAATGKLIRGNQVLNNVVSWNDSSGISNVNTQDGRVAGNLVEDNGHVMMPGNGIGVRMGLQPESRSGRIVIENNTIRNNGMDGIQIFDSDDHQILGNTIEGNGFQSPPFNFGFAGMIVNTENGGILIRDNTIRNNINMGIWLDMLDGFTTGSADNNRIEGNAVTGNGGFGLTVVYAYPGANNHVLSNYVVNSGSAEFGDLVDGSMFYEHWDCPGVVWDDNTYEIATPPCAGAGGTQVSVP